MEFDYWVNTAWQWWQKCMVPDYWMATTTMVAGMYGAGLLVGYSLTVVAGMHRAGLLDKYLVVMVAEIYGSGLWMNTA